MNTQKKPLTKRSIITSTITMNEDLKQWVSDGEQSEIISAMHVKFKDKKPTGRCDICRVRPAKSLCIKCGNCVCSSCYFTMVGLCQSCLSKETIEKWKNKKTNWKKILEVDWVD